MKRLTVFPRRLAIAALALALVSGWVRSAEAARIVLPDGRILDGNIVELISISNKPLKPRADGAPTPKEILLCDDGLRRYYVRDKGVQVLEGNTGDQPEKFVLKDQRPVRDGGRLVTSVGPMRQLTPFDEWGRRKAIMVTDKGDVTIFQGITEITPTWTRVEALSLRDATPYRWDQRIATSSLAHELLAKILAHQVNPKSIDQRLKIVKLYLQMDRYQEAQDELAQVIEDFPEHAEQFSRTEKLLAQRAAQRMLAEIKTRRTAGQHQFAMQWLANFPHEKVAGEILQEVKQTLQHARAHGGLRAVAR
jgi:tetratricopeptide (TPR) repeat protein